MPRVLVAAKVAHVLPTPTAAWTMWEADWTHTVMPVGIAKDAAGNGRATKSSSSICLTRRSRPSSRASSHQQERLWGEPRPNDPFTNRQVQGVGWLTFATRDGMDEAVRWNGCPRRPSPEHQPAIQMHTGCLSQRQAPSNTHLRSSRRSSRRWWVPRHPECIDGTFGRGGHSRGILSALSKDGRLHAFDMDPEAIKAGEALAKEDPRFTIHHAPFSSMESVFKKAGLAAPSGVFLDLGISSPAV